MIGDALGASPFLSELLVTLISVSKNYLKVGQMSSSTNSRPIVLHEPQIDSSLYASLLHDLNALCLAYGLEIEMAKLELCLRHLLYVEQVNEYINLTRITDLHDAIVLHILDSLLLIPFLDGKSSKVLDMGTGAGFPGVPLSICCGIDSVLMDSVGKKVKAVNAFIDALHINNAVGVHARLEEYAVSNSGAFDTVVVRALASVPVLIEYATPFLCNGGQLVVAKGSPDDSEIESGLRAADICGLTLIDNSDFDLPRDLGHRSVFVFEKTDAASVKLPRTAGLAKRNPLA